MIFFILLVFFNTISILYYATESEAQKNYSMYYKNQIPFSPSGGAEI